MLEGWQTLRLKKRPLAGNFKLPGLIASKLPSLFASRPP